MPHETLADRLFAEVCRIPLLDPHSHIEPLRATAKSLDDLLGYHYYTELAHSSGMSQEPLAEGVAPRERCRAILGHMDRFRNTVQYSWFLDIARTHLGFTGDRVTAADCDALFDAAAAKMSQPGWEDHVLTTANVETIFLTNSFDEPLDGFDTKRYVPCLRTDDLVFKLHEPAVRARLSKTTGVDVGDKGSLKRAVRSLFERFVAAGAKACAISLPPDFAPHAEGGALQQAGVFWLVAEHCREFGLPFDLMVGVNRRVYPKGVFQGQDLFDQRTSLIQYADLFNAFPEVTFPVSVLTSSQNQELVAYSWIFPNVVTSGHWWYANVPAFIEHDLRARLNAVPETKQLGYYSDAYKLEFVQPKFTMYRRCLAKLLASDYVEPGRLSETEAVALAKRLLRDNVAELFKL